MVEVKLNKHSHVELGHRLKLVITSLDAGPSRSR